MIFDHPLLSRLPHGYIGWRGRPVARLSNLQLRPDEFTKACRELAEHCEILDAKGFPVTERTCMFKALFREAPADTPWLQVMMSYYDIVGDLITRRARRFIFEMPDDTAVAIGMEKGQLVTEYGYETELAVGRTNLLHQLHDQGHRSCGAWHCSYHRFTQLVSEAGLTPELVAAVLSTPVPEQPDAPRSECAA